MIRIQVFNAHKKRRLPKKETLEMIRRVLKDEQCKHADLNVIGINDTKMKKLNGTYLHHHYATDVLSFYLSDGINGILEGEVYVNLDQAYRQAKDFGISFKNEVQRLIIHGVLHLVGYRDDTRKRKKLMTKREDHYLER